MEQIVQIFSSFEQAEENEIAYWSSRTGEERLESLIEILSLVELDETEAPQGMERFFRVAPVRES
jgi:hypothetical protein